MINAPEAVLLYIPLMKELGLSWSEIKQMPRYEAEGLLAAYNEYMAFHAMDGYSDEEISQLSKKKPQVRTTWHRYLETRRKFDDMLGKEKPKQTFDGLMG